MSSPSDRRPAWGRGGYLGGSASRPFGDWLFDREVGEEEGACDRAPVAQRHGFATAEGPPRRVDHEFYLRPWSELVAREPSAARELRS